MSRSFARVETRVETHMATALRLHQAAGLREAETIYRRVLEVQPSHADALHLLSVAAHHAGRPRPSI